MKTIENLTLDMERALYGSENTYVKHCTFDGPADGESAFKECRKIKVGNCFFNLRYPFWHCEELEISDCRLTDKCRAALWYSDKIKISDSLLHGIKALRECSEADLERCDIISPEFGWSSKNIKMTDCTAESEYFMLRAKNAEFTNLKMKGKYSFQYVKNAVFENCYLDTKDALWHAENVTVKNSTVKGEYLAWYCENVTFINCKIIGTQPLCYCKKLKLVDCEMVDTDLSFEKSEVEATIKGHIDSIKNPLTGEITVESVGEIIIDEPWAEGKVITE